MKFPLFLIVISFIAGIFLGGLVVFVITYQEKVEEVVTVPGAVALYEFAPIERVHFNARGKVVEIDEEKITIERLEETLSMKLAEDVRVMIISFPEEPEEIEEGVLIEPKTGSLEDIEVGMEVSSFGIQEEDGSLTVGTITIER